MRDIVSELGKLDHVFFDMHLSTLSRCLCRCSALHTNSHACRVFCHSSILSALTPLLIKETVFFLSEYRLHSSDMSSFTRVSVQSPVSGNSI